MSLINVPNKEDFSKQKIVWARLMRLTKSDINNFPRFSCVEAGIFTVDSLCFFTGKNINSLCNILNSKYAAYYFFNNVASLDDGGFQMRQCYIEEIPIPVSLIQNNASDESIFNAFKFTDDEVKFIEQKIDDKRNMIKQS